MTKKIKQDGFLLLIVIAMLPLVAMVVYMLSGSLKVMAFDTITALLEAQSRNVITSAKAWSEHNAEKLLRQESDYRIKLSIPNPPPISSTCDIIIIDVRDEVAKIEVKTVCTYGNRKLKKNIKFSLAQSGIVKSRSILPSEDEQIIEFFDLVLPQEPYQGDPNSIIQPIAEPNSITEAIFDPNNLTEPERVES